MRQGTRSGAAVAVAGLTWLAVLLLAVVQSADVVLHYVVGKPFGHQVTVVLQYVSACLLLLALIAAGLDLVATVGRSRAQGAPHELTRLGHWPGLPLAFAAIVVAMLLLLTDLPPDRVVLIVISVLAEYVTGALVLLVAIAAAVAASHRPGALELMAAPALVLALAGAVSQSSIASILVRASPGLVGVALILGTAALASGQRTLLWGSAGALLGLVLAGILATGLATPTEGLAVLAMIAVPTGLLIQRESGEGSVGQVLVDGGREMAALAGMLILAALLFRFSWVRAVIEALGLTLSRMPPAVAVALCAAAVLVAGLIFTPALAVVLICVLALPGLIRGGYDPELLAVPLMCAALVVVLLRLAARRSAPSDQRLALPVALIACAALAAVAAASYLKPLPRLL
jgi:hypothetical protein